MKKSKALNVTGQKFGFLTAIKISGKDNFNRNKWLFSCDCGEEVICSLNNVKSGITKSCGCKKRNNKSRRKDLTGLRFGKLTVIKALEYENKKLYWDCLCDCGNFKKVASVYLTHDKVKSCGCLRSKRINILGSGKWAKIIKNTFLECIKCGTNETLHAHHIIPVNFNKKTSKDLSNGVALCKKCHISFHSQYGSKINGIEELCHFVGLDNYQKNILNHFVGFRSKNGLQDLEKAKHYIDLLIEKEYAK
jgi:5-methylcytosine-specific restriction endonuclease McrA